MKKKRTVVCAVLLLLTITYAIYCFAGSKMVEQTEQQGQSAITAGKNQKLQYGLIQSIAGNEMLIQLLQEGEETAITQELQIPVGTDVETKLGNITTFSRLAAGDRIAILLQAGDAGDEILRIWMVE